MPSSTDRLDWTLSRTQRIRIIAATVAAFVAIGAACLAMLEPRTPSPLVPLVVPPVRNEAYRSMAR